MPNRTVYVKDEELWARAKGLAGKGGLSEVIEGLLKTYVADRNAEGKGFTRHSIEVYHGDGELPTTESIERVSFYGRPLASESFPRLGGGEVDLDLYQTQSGKFVLFETGHEVQAHGYVVVDSLGDLMQEPQLFGIADTSLVGQWLVDIHERRLKETARDTWID